MTPVAFPYKRFSSPSQEDGDSIRRQNALSVAWSERTTIPLDLALTLEDRGVSGFRGVSRSDADKYALAAFLKAIEVGRAQPGDFLLIENLDRLSREEEVPATHLLTSILMTGVKVVQLSPYEMELTEPEHGRQDLHRKPGREGRPREVVYFSRRNVGVGHPSPSPGNRRERIVRSGRSRRDGRPSGAARRGSRAT